MILKSQSLYNSLHKKFVKLGVDKVKNTNVGSFCYFIFDKSKPTNDVHPDFPSKKSF